MTHKEAAQWVAISDELSPSQCVVLLLDLVNTSRDTAASFEQALAHANETIRILAQRVKVEPLNDVALKKAVQAEAEGTFDELRNIDFGGLTVPLEVTTILRRRLHAFAAQVRT